MGLIGSVKKGLRQVLAAKDQFFPDLKAREDDRFWLGCRGRDGGVVAGGHDDDRMVALGDQAVFLACPFFQGTVGGGIGDVIFDHQAGGFQAGKFRFEDFFHLVELDHVAHAIVEIHHENDQNHDHNHGDEPVVGPIDFFEFLYQFLQHCYLCCKYCTTEGAFGNWFFIGKKRPPLKEVFGAEGEI